MMNLHTPLRALEITSLADSITDALRRSIIAGEFAPGQRLSETVVAERFGVARVTAKAGIDRLASEGILRRGQRKTASIPVLSTEDIGDLYFSREPVEVAAVTNLARQGRVPPDAERALAMMWRAAAEGRHTDHTEADIALHRALVASTGSERLRRMHEIVMGETQLCIAQVRHNGDVDLKALTATHAAIIEAVAAGDPDAAVRALRNDLHGCREMLMAASRRKTAQMAGLSTLSAMSGNG